MSSETAAIHAAGRSLGWCCSEKDGTGEANGLFAFLDGGKVGRSETSISMLLLAVTHNDDTGDINSMSLSTALARTTTAQKLTSPYTQTACDFS